MSTPAEQAQAVDALLAATSREELAQELVRIACGLPEASSAEVWAPDDRNPAGWRRVAAPGGCDDQPSSAIQAHLELGTALHDPGRRVLRHGAVAVVLEAYTAPGDVDELAALTGLANALWSALDPTLAADARERLESVGGALPELSGARCELTRLLAPLGRMSDDLRDRLAGLETVQPIDPRPAASGPLRLELARSDREGLEIEVRSEGSGSLDGALLGELLERLRLADPAAERLASPRGENVARFYLPGRASA